MIELIVSHDGQARLLRLAIVCNFLLTLFFLLHNIMRLTTLFLLFFFDGTRGLCCSPSPHGCWYDTVAFSSATSTRRTHATATGMVSSTPATAIRAMSIRLVVLLILRQL
ncbi:hypothetical protein DFS33DRAFT_1326348 [Desarmillaria ectypa]|nr:hypothetical protein DFS33DRAFT_1326348 [Desarmillaria ectypa]